MPGQEWTVWYRATPACEGALLSTLPRHLIYLAWTPPKREANPVHPQLHDE